ncbi:MAG: tetratricopeptide repeat protein [Alloprevotella sp.]|nr:tetratricopeptide repeat protein [Prevotellamassilia sp.]MDY5763024.1 tetratricopeptide repeat protein [Alloprevotella sp.]
MNNFAPKALKALCQHDLGQAIEALHNFASAASLPSDAFGLKSLSEDYEMMVNYMAGGYDDQAREKLYTHFLSRAAQCYCQMVYAGLRDDAPNAFAATRRTLRLMDVPHSLPEVCRHEATGRVIFDVAWTSPVWTGDDLDAAQQIIDSDHFSFTQKALLLSGTMLGALHFFDAAKLSLLLRHASHADDRLRARALAGAVLVATHHRSLVGFFPSLKEAFDTLKATPRYASELSDLQTARILSLEVKEIEKKMREEIIPGIMEHTKHLKTDLRHFDIKELQDEMARLSANPEWAEAEKNMTDKMEQLATLQQRGSDVFIGQFKSFKQNFPFFTAAANWFTPFDTDHPELPQNIRKSPVLNLLTQAAQLCDSDKYSLSFLMGQMSNSGLPINAETMDEQIKNAFESGQLPSVEQMTPAVHIRLYMQDLYRFFTLFRGRQDEVNPFADDWRFYDQSPFTPESPNPKAVHELAQLAFSIKAYEAAAPLFMTCEPSADVCQKIGFCKEMTHDYEGACEAYERADLFKDDSAWTLRRLAACQRARSKPEAALALYERLENLEPEAADLPLHAGECLIWLQRYDEALKKLYKAYYLDPDDRRVWRAMVWAELQTGHFDQAETHFSLILSHQPQAGDYVNAAHCAWLSGNVVLAITRYRLALTQMPETKPEDLLTPDKALLTAHGITQTDIYIMRDAIGSNA